MISYAGSTHLEPDLSIVSALRVFDCPQLKLLAEHTIRFHEGWGIRPEGPLSQEGQRLGLAFL